MILVSCPSHACHSQRHLKWCLVPLVWLAIQLVLANDVHLKSPLWSERCHLWLLTGSTMINPKPYDWYFLISDFHIHLEIHLTSTYIHMVLLVHIPTLPASTWFQHEPLLTWISVGRWRSKSLGTRAQPGHHRRAVNGKNHLVMKTVCYDIDGRFIVWWYRWWFDLIDFA